MQKTSIKDTLSNQEKQWHEKCSKYSIINIKYLISNTKLLINIRN